MYAIHKHLPRHSKVNMPLPQVCFSSSGLWTSVCDSKTMSGEGADMNSTSLVGNPLESIPGNLSLMKFDFSSFISSIVRFFSTS